MKDVNRIIDYAIIIWSMLFYISFFYLVIINTVKMFQKNQRTIYRLDLYYIMAMLVNIVYRKLRSCLIQSSMIFRTRSIQCFGKFCIFHNISSKRHPILHILFDEFSIPDLADRLFKPIELFEPRPQLYGNQEEDKLI